MLKATFVDFSNNFNDKHAIYSLSACLRKKGINVEYIKEKNFKKTIKKIENVKPNILLYSAFSGEVNTFIQFDKLIKEVNNNIKSIIGGPGPTYDWGILNRSTINACCVGDGEYALEEYIRSDFNSRKNIFSRGEKGPNGYFTLVDLDSLPYPERDQVYAADTLLGSINSKQFLSGKGCPYRCTYCHNNAFNEMFKSCGNIIRKKSVGYLIGEIKQVYKKYPFKVVIFQDDTFIVNKKWLFEFCERFPREVGLPYTCSIRANLINEETAKALKKSGCIQAWWSIESGNDYIREEILKRNMNKEQILETGRLLNKYKIPSRVASMIGLPGEKFENMLETIELNIEVKPDLGLGNIYVPYPSLELTEYAIKNNFLSRDAMNNFPKSFFRQSVLNFTPEEKKRIQKLLYLFPIMVKYPFLYYGKVFKKSLFVLPERVLQIFYYAFFMNNIGKLYRFKQSFKESFFMIIRYLRDV